MMLMKWVCEMHRLKFHENEHAPCNAYCAGDTHVDMVYLAQVYVDKHAGHLINSVREGFRKACTMNENVEIVAIRPAPEGEDAKDYYPRSHARRPGSTLPYLITYRLGADEV